MSRLQTRFVQLKQGNHATLIIFVITDDPDCASSLEILKGLPTVGAGVIGLDMPSADPMADGPTIQLASIRTLDDDQILTRTLQTIHEFRSNDSETPLVLMGYFDPIHYYGVERFIAEVKEVGVDGLTMVDLPLEHNEDLCHPAQAAGLDSIHLTTPTIGGQRLPAVLEGSPGFVYYVPMANVADANATALEHVEETVARLCQHTDLPIGIGFGIRSAEHATAVMRLVDGMVAGSALIDRIAKAHDNAQTVKNVPALCGELAEGVRNAR